MSNVMSDLRIRWAENLRVHREAAGLTQAELADAVGTIQQRISAWEGALTTPRDEMRIKLARALGCTVYDIFDYPDENGAAA